MVIFIIVQCIGAVIASALLLTIIAGLPGYDLAANDLGQNGFGTASPARFSLVSGFIAHVVLTFIFLIVIFGATSKNTPAGFAIIPTGFTLALIHIVGTPITGTSVNPARSAGHALAAGGAALSQLWMFIGAPGTGAVYCGACMEIPA